MTDATRQQKRRRTELLHERDALVRLGRQERDALRAQSGAQTDVPDEADLSTLDLMADLDLALLQIRTEAITNIDEAIERIDHGSYGVCQECGGEIPAARLRAVHFAERCRACEEIFERGHMPPERIGAMRSVHHPFQIDEDARA